jgi:glucan 1,4-alpha-glucosidase
MVRPRADVLRRGAVAALAVGALAAASLAAPLTAASAATPRGGHTPRGSGGPAAGGPGAMSHFDLARKDCLGTARNRTSKVWYTVAGGVLSDVYYPTIDTTNVETLQYVVTDGSTFTDLQTRDMTYTVRALDSTGMACRVTSTARSGRYSITTDYFTDPARDSVVMRTSLDPRNRRDDLRLYVRFDATVNGNGGGGTLGNGGADDAVTDRSRRSPVPVSGDTTTATIAANRDYATPVFAALSADRPFRAVSSGYAGTASDGLTQLDADHRLATTYDRALDGNVVQTAQVDVRRGRPVTLALGFGTTRAAAVSTAAATARTSTGAMLASYRRGWESYDRHLTPPARPRHLGRAEQKQLAETYYLSANVLKASEDKTYPGAIVASLASPWGQAVAAGDPALTYFGSYREVFARDLYETFTGLIAAGDVATARDTVRFLFERQQQADGSMPRNSLVNGKLAPDSFGVQLDEVAYPILMARTVGLTDKAFYTSHIKRAADFVVARGPSFGSERWEEQSGYSPSTIAAEIAGLAAAGAIAEKNGDATGARIYRATADHYQRTVKAWTVTSNGPLSDSPYFIRLSKNADPTSAFTYNLGNGGPDADQRAVVDQGFLELARLGALPTDDPEIASSLPVVDRVIRESTASGDGFYRYGTDTPGTEDGYGDCYTGDPTSCTVQGKPWAGVCDAQVQNQGSGHLWPALAAERGEHAVATGDTGSAVDLWRSMANSASGIGLIPEQFWENPDLAASSFGTRPECASIGFTNGKAAGSASPLTWSAASFVRLSADLRAGRITDRPEDTTARYITNSQAGTTVTLTAPENNSLVTGGTTTVTGTTAPGATVDVDAVNIDIEGATTTATTTAGADGAFSVDVTVPAGTVNLTVLATAPDGATGYAQRTVVYDVVPGTLVFEASDPTGDDNGPGTYAHPTAGDFKPGAYDLQAFQVYDSGPDSVTFRVQTANLAPTFGSPLGAQLVDVYVRDPAAVTTSTAASFPQRNYTIDPASAWNRLIEVQGFGQRFIDAGGGTVGSVAIRASEATRYITFTVSKTALGGTPASGWSFAVVLTGQDGFSPDQARGFQAQAQDYQFGVCTAAAVAAQNPICAVDPGTVPKAVDVATPAGVDQANELNPLNGPVVIRGVAVP